MVCAEMALTGESDGVRKNADYVFNSHATSKSEGGKEQTLTSPNMAYMGCSILDGRGKGVVVRTGMTTRMGKIAQLLNDAEAGLSPLQEKLEKLGKTLGIMSIAVSLIVLVLGIALKRSPDPKSESPYYLQMIIVAVSLVVAAVPEGLPAAVTITLALGMRRMADKQVIIRKLHSVETLGSATVICSDKTGTLTAGVMTVRKIYFGGNSYRVTGEGYDPNGKFLMGSDDAEVWGEGWRVCPTCSSEGLSVSPQVVPTVDTGVGLLLLAGTLCSNATLEKNASGQWECMGNTSERAIVVAAAKGHIDGGAVHKEYVRVKENVFSSSRKVMSVVAANSSARPYRFPTLDQPASHIGIVKGRHCSPSSTQAVANGMYVRGAERCHPPVQAPDCCRGLGRSHCTTAETA